MVNDLLSVLSTVLGELAETAPARLCDRESLVALHRAHASLEAILARSAAAFEASGAYADDGAQQATTWCSIEWHAPRREAQRFLRLGRAVSQLPVVEEAWVTGSISASHVQVIASAENEKTRDALRRDQDQLCGLAEKLSFRDFCRAVAYWRQQADPNGTELDAEVMREQRSLHLDQSFEGMFFAKATLDPISGEIVNDELSRLENLLFEADWQAAKERLGRDPHLDELAHSPAQRRADALVEMAKRSASMPTDARSPRPLFSVLVDWPSLSGRICELANGTVISPGSLVPYLEKAMVERAVFGADRRIEVSEKARLYTGATRRAIELRDRSCTHPYCERPAAICQVDHIVPYSEGGPTTQENGRLLCQFHNRLRLRSERPPPAGDEDDPDPGGWVA